jgi:hypothetical protein
MCNVALVLHAPSEPERLAAEAVAMETPALSVRYQQARPTSCVCGCRG